MSNLTENRLSNIFKNNKKKISIYLTAGYPNLTDTVKLLKILESAGVDFVEIGIPFSDSVMDGPVILNSHKKALENGMTLDFLFSQLEVIRKNISVPVVLMGSMNPVYQYGFENFCKKCGDLGVDGLLLPDLPLLDFKKYYQDFYQQNNLAPIFMISPQTSPTRLAAIDEAGAGFLYAVSSSSTTGSSTKMEDNIGYFEKLGNLKLKNPVAVGFNINTKNDVRIVHQYADAAIIGSAFIKEIEYEIDESRIIKFINGLEN
ncbi:tryptophan synthase subunit alpha [Dyadobacter sp. CY345]|uniref:tryptophan synthase subunit alpha n=1 Tax=Dyadobacter sp. CY345 TaxID=2909335 RepID=UPI001F1F4A5A|nr:tryptophan synthase subunit alpha [Dyadobacter sp. CY345]MCF2443577.1 tryptophan synthase subunit alpha [Dyadobacter sp. CY345]